MVSTETKRFRVSFPEAIVAAVIVVLLLALLIPAIRAAREATSYGLALPVTAPDESRRQYHENGMSLIVPVDWRRSQWRSQRDETRIDFDGGGRFHSTLFAERLSLDFDTSRFDRPWDFNGAPLMARQSKVDNGGGRKGRYFVFEFVVNGPDAQYLVGFESREDIDSVPEMVMHYLRSFRLPTTSGEPSKNAPNDAS